MARPGHQPRDVPGLAPGGSSTLPHVRGETLEADTHRRFLRGCMFGPGGKSRRHGPAPRLSLSAALLVVAGACAKTPPQSSPATGSVTVGVTSRGPGVENLTFGVSIEPGGINGADKGDVGIFTARNVPPGNHV